MGFIDLLATVVIGGFALVALILILLALPNSPFRDVALQGALWVFVLGCGLLFVSPVDLLPIPFLPIDDVLYGAGGISASAMAVWQHIKSKAANTSPPLKEAA